MIFFKAPLQFVSLLFSPSLKLMNDTWQIHNLKVKKKPGQIQFFSPKSKKSDPLSSSPPTSFSLFFSVTAAAWALKAPKSKLAREEGAKHRTISARNLHEMEARNRANTKKWRRRWKPRVWRFGMVPNGLVLVLVFNYYIWQLLQDVICWHA